MKALLKKLLVAALLIAGVAGCASTHPLSAQQKDWLAHPERYAS